MTSDPSYEQTTTPIPVLPYEPRPVPPAPVDPGASRWVMPLLTVASSAAAIAMYARGSASLLEAVSFVTGALCVWLTVRESVWNFPISLVNVTAFAVVFFHAHLFADAGLQVVYFGLTLAGWYMWLYGGERRTALRVRRVGAVELTCVLIAGVVLTFTLWVTLRYFGGSASFWDALTTALSLCAQWLLNRKQLENWYFWIVADVIYVPLYAYKQLYLSSGLYAAFLLMCVMGVVQWRKTWQAHSDAALAEAA